MNELNKSQKPKPTVQFDPTDYIQHLEGLDVTEAEATEILRTLWDIMIQFVDLGFTVNGTTESALKNKEHSAVKLDSKNTKALDTEGQTP